jgi:hypothetical protein
VIATANCGENSGSRSCDALSCSGGLEFPVWVFVHPRTSRSGGVHRLQQATPRTHRPGATLSVVIEWRAVGCTVFLLVTLKGQRFLKAT